MLRALRECSCLVVFLVFTLFGIAQQPQSASADEIWNQLLAGNRRFATGKAAPHNLQSQRESLTKTQHPRVAVLELLRQPRPPELIFDEGLGDLFVVRSAGEDDDAIVIGSLEYAVEHLGSTVIVVMGHQGCGAVTAACSGGKPESDNLDAVVSPIAPSCTKMDRAKPETLDLAVRDHVHRVSQEILARSELLRKAAEEHKIGIIEAYYSLDTGEVTRLH